MIPRNPIEPGTTPKLRCDGWTAARREAFLDALTEGLAVWRACARVGLSREGAYRLRARDTAFAQAWAAAQRAAGDNGDRRFLELLAERMPAVAAAMSANLRERGFFRQDSVTPGPSL